MAVVWAAQTSIQVCRRNLAYLEKGVGVTQAIVPDQLGVCCKPITPVGPNATLGCAFQEEGHLRRHAVDCIHS